MMAKLLCIANWPADGNQHPDYPLYFQLEMEPSDEDTGWLDCTSTIQMTTEVDADPVPLSSIKGQVLQRDIQRLVADLQELVNQTSTGQLTFVPVTPLFEMWISRLSDDQFRVVIWQDMTNRFSGASEIGYEGVRFLSNRARLMGFIRGLDAAAKPKE